MIDVLEALKLKLKDKIEPTWFEDTSEYIGKVAAYNQALTDVTLFLEQLESGDVTEEYLTELRRQQG